MGGSGKVGGDPTTIEAGSVAIGTETSKMPSIRSTVTSTCRSCSTAVDLPEAQDMIDHFSTVWSTFLDDLQIQMSSASRLAQFGSQDLAAATGDH